MPSLIRFSTRLLLACLTAAACTGAQAQLPPPVPKGQEAMTPRDEGDKAEAPPLPETQNADAKFQSTYIWQGKAPFNSPYQGPNSFSPNKESSYTWTVTAYFGLRPWKDGEIYFNPEGIQGRALSNVTGLGGPTNAELQKAVSPEMRFYRARLFYRHTFGLGGTPVGLESDQNQLAGTVDSRRFVLTVGNLSLTDVMGTSDIAGDGRTQFLNWATLDHGAYDYAADARGFSWGVFGELYWDHWAIRGGRFLQPRVSNGLQLDYRIFKRYGDQVELERRFTLGGQPGVLKGFVFRNVANMGAYAEALSAASVTGNPPVLADVRHPQSKWGGGVSWEQSFASDIRGLVRASANDGHTESYAFTEIDRSLFTALQVTGDRWGRAPDTLGIAWAVNGLSTGHRAYLAAGGLGFFLGDGQLNYGNEKIFEAYYSYIPFSGVKGLAISLDWQHITNPGYNRDRGPVDVGSIRVHYEF